MSTEVAAAVLALSGVAAVVAISWLFYRIGRAEDREREQAAAAAREQESDGNHRPSGVARERRRSLPPRRPR
jgi:hypothetical protein